MLTDEERKEIRRVVERLRLTGELVFRGEAERGVAMLDILSGVGAIELLLARIDEKT